jgi:hypothetical protein
MNPRKAIHTNIAENIQATLTESLLILIIPKINRKRY